MKTSKMNKHKIILLLLLFVVNMISSQEIKEISKEWVSFTRSIALKTKVKRKFIVEASAKVVEDNNMAWSGIWARVDNKDNTRGFFDNMQDRPIIISEWQSYIIEGTFDSNSEKLAFGGICSYSGQFFFDNFKVYLENDKGEFELVELSNADFEQEIKDNNVQHWNFGISKRENARVKGFDASSSDDKVNGKYSLLIEGKDIVPEYTSTIGSDEGTSPQIEAMISMLDDLKRRVENQVKYMSQYELDYLHDEDANRIGSLIMHLAAAEKYYQVLTFENRGFTEEEKKIWQVPFDLDQGGRDEIRGQDAQYYLDIYNAVRAKTIEELKKRDDAWFKKVQNRFGYSNHYCWFHVMEHQSSHLGQILFLKKRIPPEPEKIEFKQQIKN
jgi:hypothetical protein